MSTLRRFWERLSNSAPSRRRDKRLLEEIEEHLALQTAENIRGGLSPAEARRQAKLKFGPVESMTEDYRAAQSLHFIETLLQDIRYALRILRKSPGFTTVAILTLALGIGANTAMFSVVNATILAPLPFKDPSQLVNIHAHATFFDFWNLGLSLPDINDIRSQSKSFSAIAPFEYANLDLTSRHAPRQLDAAKIPANFFSLLGVRPLYGRTFLPSEIHPGTSREVILSKKFWRAQFGSDPHVMGTAIMLDREPYTVIGIMPEMPHIFPPTAVQVWIPFIPTPDELATRGNHGIPVLARLIQGATVRHAQAELDNLAARLAKSYPNDDKGWSFRVESIRGDMTRETRTPLLILIGAVGFVLLIACANTGNLFLSRGWTRRSEFAIRSALGATRSRLLCQLLVESSLVGVAGGACGLLAAYWSVGVLTALAEPVVFGSVPISIDSSVLLFTLAISLFSTLLFGLAPAFACSRSDLMTATKEGASARTASSGGPRPGVGRVLVVAELALALVLVIGATLALVSFSRLTRVNLGFDTERVLAIHLDFPAAKFKTPATMFAYLHSLTGELGAIPGVESISQAKNSPLSGSHGEAEFVIDGRHENSKAQLTADWSTVGAAYFQTLGIPLLRGRTFSNSDDAKTIPVVIVNRSFARKFFGPENPVGRRIGIGTRPDIKDARFWNEIVGEVGDVRSLNPRAAPTPAIYACFDQSEFGGGLGPSAEILVRTRTNPHLVFSALQRRLWAFDPNQPISRIETMRQRAADSVASPRFQSVLLGSFGGLGLLLAMIGIYGVISYSVAQRTHEVGIRMALGANPAQILRLTLSQGLRLALIGAGIGILASFGLTRLMASLLFGVSATDPLTFISVTLVLIVVALAACYIPARRAMRVDPVVALRHE